MHPLPRFSSLQIVATDRHSPVNITAKFDGSSRLTMKWWNGSYEGSAEGVGSIMPASPMESTIHAAPGKLKPFLTKNLVKHIREEIKHGFLARFPGEFFANALSGESDTPVNIFWKRLKPEQEGHYNVGIKPANMSLHGTPNE